MEKKIQNRLNEMDLNLFLDKVAYDGVVFYCVKEQPTLGEEPYPVLLWRDELGRPLPLSDELIIQLRLQEGNIREKLQEAKVNNAILKESRRAEIDEHAETVSKEFEKSAKKLYTSGPWAPKHDVTAWSNRQKKNRGR